jgi:hypothetical protein
MLWRIVVCHGSAAGGAAVLADLPAGSNPKTQHLIMGGGKDGVLYVLNRDTLGGLGDVNAVQKLTMNEIFATGAFWNNNFYIAGVGGAAGCLLPEPLCSAIHAEHSFRR